MMKRIILCMVISMSLCTMLMGQNEQKPTQNYPHQEVSISYGDVLLAISPINTQGTSSYPNHNWFAPNTYKGDEVSPGAFSLSYMYGIKKWLWLGVSATYTSFYQNVYDFSHIKRLRPIQDIRWQSYLRYVSCMSTRKISTFTQLLESVPLLDYIMTKRWIYIISICIQ